MTLDKILSISGKPGLFNLISQTKTHLVVESLEDGKRFPIMGANQINTLGNIAIYTYTKEVPLAEVFYAIFQKAEEKETISHTESNVDLMAFFGEILPDFDTEKVYASNVKKVIQWYNLLHKANFDFTTLAPKELDEKTAE
jgi:hypothetical protein